MRDILGKATLLDVARAGGVSRSTAGLVLNGKAEKLKISPETAERVRRAAAELGYLNNSAVYQLRTKRTRQVAYIMTTGGMDLAALNPFVFSMIRGLQERDYQTLVIDVALKSIEINPLFLKRHFDGMVIDGTVPNQSFFEKWGDKYGVPYVYLNHDAMERNHAGNDEKRIAEMLVDALRGRGFRDIAFYFPRDVNSNPLYPPNHIFSREKRLREAMAARGMTLYPDTVEQSRHRPNAAAYLMTLPKRPDCVIGYDTFHGIDFTRNIAGLGLSIPRDVGLVVYEWSKYNRAERIAGVKFDFDKIGRDLAEMILERIETRADVENRLTSATLVENAAGLALDSLDHFGGSRAHRDATGSVPSDGAFRESQTA